MDDYHWHIEILPIVETRSKSYSIKEVYYNAFHAGRGGRKTAQAGPELVRRSEHGGIFFRLLFLLVFLAFLAVLYVVRHPLMRLAGRGLGGE